MTAHPEYGRRLIINLVDDLARDEPDRVIYSIARSADISEGVRDITAQNFANAVNRTAWWIESELGRGSSFQSVGFIGPYCDFRYILIILGCVKAGYKALLPSPRNTVEATLAVLEKAECEIWASPRDGHEVLHSLLARRPMKVIEIPETDELLRTDTVAPYPYTKSFQDAANDPFCVLHTSGSTGLPKPIFWKNSLFGTLDASRLLPKVESNGLPPWTTMFENGDKFYSTFPLHHSAGLIMNILVRFFYGTNNLIGPVGVLPTIDLVDSLLDNADIRIWSIIPSIVDEIGETPSVLNKFAHSKVIIASGGPVTYTSANKATAVVRVFNLTGTTEGLFQGILLIEPEDWIYFSFHPWAGFEFRELDNNVHEHWAVRHKEHAALHQGIFHTFPDTQELTFKDLYEKHPTKPGLWLFKGRIDDLLVMSSGEKVRPLGMESIINSHPAVSACLMIGTGYAMTSLLVELAVPLPNSTGEREALLDSILEKIHTANAVGSKEARLFREYVWFAKPDKPFARTDKKTVKRRETLILYEDEIKDFYRNIENSGGAAVDIDLTSLESTIQGIRQLLVVAGVPMAQEIGLENNLLHAGMDSLAAITISNSLRLAIANSNIGPRQTGPILTTRFVYSNPSILGLAKALERLANDPTESDSEAVQGQNRNSEELLAKYSADLRGPASEEADGLTVMLTGSTGSLGTYLLDSIFQWCPQVRKIYCLNRSKDAREKQTAACKRRGLAVDWPTHRVEFLQVDLSVPMFGLEQGVFQTLLDETTHIIHNQWPVNFNWNLSDFEPSIHGLRRLIDFSLASARGASLSFVSSDAVVSHLQSANAIPETTHHTPLTKVDGYAASKYTAELLIEQAVAKSNLKASICRVGQIAGPVLPGHEQGMWPQHELIPTIIATSKYLGVLPSTLGISSQVDWIPVDLVANVLIELAPLAPQGIPGSMSVGADVPARGGRDSASHPLTAQQGSAQVYHVISPTSIPWDALAPKVASRLGESIRIVPWEEWMDTLRHSIRNTQGPQAAAHNPVVKLIDFLEVIDQKAGDAAHSHALDIRQALKASPTMNHLQPKYNNWVDMWMKQWGF